MPDSLPDTGPLATSDWRGLSEADHAAGGNSQPQFYLWTRESATMEKHAPSYPRHLGATALVGLVLMIVGFIAGIITLESWPIAVLLVGALVWGIASILTRRHRNRGEQLRSANLWRMVA